MQQVRSVIAWTPTAWARFDTSGKIAVGPWPDQTGWSKPYSHKAGACKGMLAGLSASERIAQLFIDFHTCVVRDGIPVADAHREFLMIDEYRERISPDIAGASR